MRDNYEEATHTCIPYYSDEDKRFVERELARLDNECGDPCKDAWRVVDVGEPKWEERLASMRSC